MTTGLKRLIAAQSTVEEDRKKGDAKSRERKPKRGKLGRQVGSITND